jgi:hypothetical protein
MGILARQNPAGQDCPIYVLGSEKLSGINRAQHPSGQLAIGSCPFSYHLPSGEIVANRPNDGARANAMCGPFIGERGCESPDEFIVAQSVD